MRISDWSSDVCSSDLAAGALEPPGARPAGAGRVRADGRAGARDRGDEPAPAALRPATAPAVAASRTAAAPVGQRFGRSEEHTSELQSLMRNSSAVFCLKKKTKTKAIRQTNNKQHKNQD